MNLKQPASATLCEFVEQSIAKNCARMQALLGGDYRVFFACGNYMITTLNDPPSISICAARFFSELEKMELNSKAWLKSALPHAYYQ